MEFSFLMIIIMCLYDTLSDTYYGSISSGTGNNNYEARLYSGDVLYSVTDSTRVEMESNGNFVLYDPNGNNLWDTNTNNNPGAFVKFQHDGKLRVKDSTDTIELFDSKTFGHTNESPHSLNVIYNCVYAKDKYDTVFWEQGTGCDAIDATPIPTLNPTAPPTPTPTSNPTQNPTAKPTPNPTSNPTAKPTVNQTQKPTRRPTSTPTNNPTPMLESYLIACGDEITGDYKGDHITFTLQMTFGGDLQFDSRLSEIDILYLRGFNSAGEMIQNDLDHDKQLILSDVTSGDYYFEIHAKSGTNGMYNVKLICTFDEQSVIETLTTEETLNTMEYKGNDEDVNPYLILALLSTSILILMCCGKCAMCYVYKKMPQEHEKQKASSMMEMGQMAHQQNIMSRSNSMEDSLSNDINEKNDGIVLNELLVCQWLEDSVQLPQYIPSFIENGFDSMKSVQNVDEKQLCEIGIMNKVHQMIIMKEIEKQQPAKATKGHVVDPIFEDDVEGFGECEPQPVYDQPLPPQPQPVSELNYGETKLLYDPIGEENEDSDPDSDIYDESTGIPTKGTTHV